MSGSIFLCFGGVLGRVWQHLGTMSDVSDSSSIRTICGASGSIPMETYSSPISIVKLDGINYLTWSESVKISIRGRGKWGYILGDTKAPTRDDPTYAKWEADDSLVMSWLIHSMEPSISKTCLFLSSSKSIWDSLARTYSVEGHIGLVYELG